MGLFDFFKKKTENELNNESDSAAVTGVDTSESAEFVESEAIEFAKNGNAEVKVSELEAVESETVESEAGEAEVIEKEIAESEINESEINESEINESEINESEINESEINELEITESEAVKAEDIGAEITDSGIAQSEAGELKAAELKADETEAGELKAAESEADETEVAESEINESENDALEEVKDETDGKSEEKKGFFIRLKEGLSKTRKSITDSFDMVFGATNIDEDFYEEIEEILIMSDIGVATTEKIIDELRVKVKEKHIKEPSDCKQLLIDTMKEQMSVDEHAYDFEKDKAVVLVIGVNGVGKTTSIGKLAAIYKNSGKKVMMCAADTFRAAAVEQLVEWSNRAGVEIIKGVEGQDPASVVFDALKAAKARNTDILICDTAGRLHNKKNLMEELKKIHRIIDKEYPNARRETLVVLDGTTGQNALVQAKEFHEAAEATGIILTKLDGTSKGGIAVAVQSELNIPVKFIGVGEGINDLQRFDADSFVNAMFE